MTQSSGNLRLLAALDQLDAAVGGNIDRADEIRRRLRLLRRELLAGAELSEVLAEEPRPSVVELISLNIDALHNVGADYRKSLAETLRATGLTMQQIADLFGVTRQRISGLLKQPSHRIP